MKRLNAKKLILSALFASVLLLVISGRLRADVGTIIGNMDMQAPADPIVQRPRETSESQGSFSPAAVLNQSLFFMYQQMIGPTRGTRCPMSPTCSELGRIAIRNHGLPMGVLLTFERLYRCGQDLKYYNTIGTEHGVSYEDPPPSP